MFKAVLISTVQYASEELNPSLFIVPFLSINAPPLGVTGKSIVKSGMYSNAISCSIDSSNSYSSKVISNQKLPFTLSPTTDSLNSKVTKPSALTVHVPTSPSRPFVPATGSNSDGKLNV